MDNVLEVIRNCVYKKSECREEYFEYLYRNKCFYILKDCDDKKMNMCKLTNKLLNHIKWEMCKPLFNDINREEICYCVYKGEVLSKLAYNDLKYRISSDIDIVIDINDLKKMDKILQEHGFVQGYVENGKVIRYDRAEKIYYEHFTHQTAPYIKSTGNSMLPYILIDLNLSIIWGDCKDRINTKQMLTKYEYISIVDDLKIRKFVIEYELLALCLHLYKDLNSLYILYEKGIRLSQIVEIGYYIENNIDLINVKLFINICKEYRVEKFILHVMIYLDSIFKNKFILECLNEFKTIGDEIIICCGLPSEGIKKWNMSLEERIICEDFHHRFRKMLDDKDIERIEYNITMQH